MGSLYVGVCGREFHLDPSANDLQRGSSGTYVLRDNANVDEKAINDRRNQKLLTENSQADGIFLGAKAGAIAFLIRDRDEGWRRTPHRRHSPRSTPA